MEIAHPSISWKGGYVTYDGPIYLDKIWQCHVPIFYKSLMLLAGNRDCTCNI